MECVTVCMCLFTQYRSAVLHGGRNQEQRYAHTHTHTHTHTCTYTHTHMHAHTHTHTHTHARTHTRTYTHRVYALECLKNGEKDILVATDVAGRGIDIR